MWILLCSSGAFNFYQMLILYFNNLSCSGFFGGFPNDQEVTVEYVDFGSIAHLTLKDIRRIKKEFLSFPEKVKQCLPELCKINIISVDGRSLF